MPCLRALSSLLLQGSSPACWGSFTESFFPEPSVRKDWDSTTWSIRYSASVLPCAEFHPDGHLPVCGRQCKERPFHLPNRTRHFCVHFVYPGMAHHPVPGFSGRRILMEPRCAPLLTYIAVSVPCAAIHACINGYYYGGMQRTRVPAFAQVVEQSVRIGAVFLIADIMMEPV